MAEERKGVDFTVVPEDGGGAVVTIATTLQPKRRGLLGAIERTLGARFLRPVYLRELANLERVARAHVAG